MKTKIILTILLTAFFLSFSFLNFYSFFYRSQINTLSDLIKISSTFKKIKVIGERRNTMIEVYVQNKKYQKNPFKYLDTMPGYKGLKNYLTQLKVNSKLEIWVDKTFFIWQIKEKTNTLISFTHTKPWYKDSMKSNIGFGFFFLLLSIVISGSFYFNYKKFKYKTQ